MKQKIGVGPDQLETGSIAILQAMGHVIGAVARCASTVEKHLSALQNSGVVHVAARRDTQRSAVKSHQIKAGLVNFKAVLFGIFAVNRRQAIDLRRGAFTKRIREQRAGNADVARKGAGGLLHHIGVTRLETETA